MESCHPQEIDLSLGRVAQVGSALDLTRSTARVVTVAGTNGKGSCVAALQALLLSEGARVGSYTSPHIERFNERIQIDGRPLSDAQLCELFEAVDRARADISLTYFEFGTLAALLAFKRAKLDYLVLEVGLGGRLDAVNILDPDVAIITSIALDHQQWLGNDRESIGREKAGILRAGVPFIYPSDGLPESVAHRAESLLCETYALGEALHLQVQPSGAYRMRVRDTQGCEQEYALPSLNLPAPSVLAALQAYHLLSGALAKADIERCLSEVSLDGRFQRHRWQNINLVIDVAHNPEAAELLASRLRSSVRPVRAVVFAVMADKDIAGIVDCFAPLNLHWYCCDLDAYPRAAKGRELCRLLTERGQRAEYSASPSAALQAVQAAEGEGDVMVFGSFYLIAEIMPCLRGDVAR